MEETVASNLYAFAANSTASVGDTFGLAATPVPDEYGNVLVTCDLIWRKGNTCQYECRCPAGYNMGFTHAFTTQPCSFAAPTRTCVPNQPLDPIPIPLPQPDDLKFKFKIPKPIFPVPFCPEPIPCITCVVNTPAGPVQHLDPKPFDFPSFYMPPASPSAVPIALLGLGAAALLLLCAAGVIPACAVVIA